MIEEFAERTEQPTPKRLHEAREEGQVFQSRDLAAALFLCAVTLIVWASATAAWEQSIGLLQQWFSTTASGELTVAMLSARVMEFADAVMRLVLPVLLLVWLAGYLATFIQVGWVFTAKPIQPDVARLNPIKGLQRIFGVSGLLKAALDLLKVFLVAIVVTMTIIQHSDRIMTLAQLELHMATQGVAWLLVDLAWRVLVVLLILGMLDLLYQRWKHTRDLRMTRQQVREELKQTEGDPEIRRRRGRSRHASTQRLSIHRT